MKHLLSLSLFGVVSLSLSAQSTLSSSSNLPRQGDRIIKQQVVYNDPGQSGTEIVWNFSEQKAINENYELKYTALNTSSDTLIGTEHRTMYYYHSRGDSLFSLGYENPTTLINFREPELLLVFPMPYGRSFTDYFNGRGNYCNRLAIHIQGKSTVTADAIGMMIIPGGDTLRHVLRVHTVKKMVEKMIPTFQSDTTAINAPLFILNRDSVDYHLAHDSVRYEVDTWRWYAYGYRYPVFETIKSCIYKADKAYDPFSTSFYYPPHEQYYSLASDSENQQKRDCPVTDPEVSRKDSDITFKNQYKDEAICYGYSVNEEGDLCINYTLYRDMEVTVGLYDLQGRQLAGVQTLSQTQGSYQNILGLSRCEKGEYLLRLTFGEKVYGTKIVK